MSDLSNLKFPSGRSFKQVKKDAKRLRRSQDITLTEALNQCANENGISLPWDQAVEQLKRQALSASILEEQIYLHSHFKPSNEYFDLVNKARGFPPKNTTSSLQINLSLLPSHVYETLLCHPTYNRLIERFMQFSDFKLEVKHPHRTARYRDDDWRLEITFDGYSGEGNNSYNDVWLEFREWLMQFGSTQRVQVTERIDKPSYSKLVTQTHWEWTPLDFVNRLELDVDKAFYCQMISDGFNFASIKWHHCDFTVVKRMKESFDSNRVAAMFEYTLDGKTDTVSCQIQEEVNEYNAQIRVMQLYVIALSMVMRHHNLTTPNVPMKLLNIEMGKELSFGIPPIR
ncbi:hypothetical protein TUMSATVNIG1_60320 (plasmid) [Vibrio nigripulchritudo]|uniref:hypothetical protein n=1 Tax=Vibrio nigripulchritudo TaxID=28173 RepID=UPI00190B2F01|nr:hypothetical protein [Vibrio nigripulchritudo]BCL74046.1 hypothetical protein VNTUMSATTG_59830 [Vibrio nigripulchritudo]BDU35423.1 hypothetical protein TUMSATVNIG1_60320 [Vibrio nigripulchritudo]